MKTEQFQLLAVGNSFSEDALYYIHDICAAAGVSCRVVNLYLGGCSLQRHCENVISGEQVYEYQCDGHFDGRMVSLQEALAEEAWDYILMQQASHDSGWPDTYEPFLSSMAGYLRQQCPGAQLLLQETWAYETDSTHDKFARYHNDQKEMYRRLCRAYKKASEGTGIPLIPCGDIIQTLREREPFRYGEGGMSLCRDGFHMSYLYGRYALAAAWYKAVTGRSLKGNRYVPETEFAGGEMAEPKLLELIRQVVEEAVPEALRTAPGQS